MTQDQSLSLDSESVTLAEARALLPLLSQEHSVLLLSPPGVGKSDVVRAAAADADLECRSLLGTQIAPEDVSGVPMIVGERSVFCPPRVLLPEHPSPFCLFLDELPACSPEIQKAFYSLLLERRLGEHRLPQGTWVVAAGNRAEDRALVRALSSALVNRVFILHVRPNVHEWLRWAASAGVRSEIRTFLLFCPEALLRPVPTAPVPFSTPRAWASLSSALDKLEAGGLTSPSVRRALVFGRVSAEDAAVFCALYDSHLHELGEPELYVRGERLLPWDLSPRWFVLNAIRAALRDGRLSGIEPIRVREFLGLWSQEELFVLFLDLVPQWAALGASDVLLRTLKEVTGL